MQHHLSFLPACGQHVPASHLRPDCPERDLRAACRAGAGHCVMYCSTALELLLPSQLLPAVWRDHFICYVSAGAMQNATSMPFCAPMGMQSVSLRRADLAISRACLPT